MVGDDPIPFFGLDGFSVGVVLVSANGSVTVSTTGIHEDAVLEEGNTGRASTASFQPQITVPTNDGRLFGEGDTATFIPAGGVSTSYVILDSFPDDIQTTLTLEES